MKPALPCLALLALGGCVSLLPEPAPPPRLFVLEGARSEPAAASAIPAVIAVARPAGDRTLLGPDLVWRTGDELAYVGGAQWAGRAQDLMQSLLVETIARSGDVRAAVRTGEARADYEIRWDLLDFEIVEEGASLTARFVADAKLIHADTRAVLGARLVTSEAPLSDRSAGAAADALARAAREGGARIASYAVETIRGVENAADEAQESAASISR